MRDKIALTEHGNIPLLPRKVKQRGCERSMGEIKKMRCMESKIRAEGLM